MSLSSLSSSEAAAVASALQLPADKLGNDATVELLWAMKAHHHAETYYKLLQAVPPSTLRLTKIDSEIHAEFRSKFPDLDVRMLDVEQIKSADGKEQWRPFCNQFEGQVADWNMATLLRVNSGHDMTEENTVIVPRIQFLAIEIARNREGFNNDVHKTATENVVGAS